MILSPFARFGILGSLAGGGLLTVANEDERYALTGIAVGQQVYQTEAAVLVSEAGTTAANGAYTYRGDFEGLPYYNLSGKPNSLTDFVIISGSGFWKINGAGGALLYQWEGMVIFPWLVPEWSVVSGDGPAPTVTEQHLFQLNAPSSVISAVGITGPIYSGMNGIYTQRETYDGKSYYNLLGTPDDPLLYSIRWSDMDGAWQIANDMGTVEYYANDITNFPWEATGGWYDTSLNPSDVVATSITKGELDAGVTVSGAGDPAGVGTYIRGTAYLGRHTYISGDNNITYDDTFDRFNVNGSGFTIAAETTAPPPFPWESSWAVLTAERSDIAAPANWSAI